MIYDIVYQYPLKSTIHTYDIYLRCPVRYSVVPKLAWSCCRRCWSHWPGPCWSNGSSLVILGPCGWSALHNDSPHALPLSLIYHTARNVCGDSLVRGKSGSAPGARAAVVAPTADKVTECDGRAGHGHGGVWQVSKWTGGTVFKLREAEQGYTE